jgi:hypothetical protein
MRDGLAINGKRERLSHAQIVERRVLRTDAEKIGYRELV